MPGLSPSFIYVARAEGIWSMSDSVFVQRLKKEKS